MNGYTASPFAGRSEMRDGRGGREVGADNRQYGDRIRRLEALYASQLPIDAIAGLDATDVQGALEELQISTISRAKARFLYG